MELRPRLWGLWVGVLVAVLAGSISLSVSPPADAAEAPAPAEVETSTEILLMTMGPGDALYAQGGHAALMVAQMRGEQMVFSDVYNFGDTDWDDSSIPWKFITGTLEFRLDRPGDMFDVAENYGLRQNRDVYLQKLALTPAQAEQVATHLEATLAPDRRDYPYHYVEAICTTKIRDLLDEVLGGAIREQLQPKVDALTTRDYQQISFDGYPLAGLGADLLMGRPNDTPIDQYYSLFYPDHMRVRFEEVMVPDPGGSGSLVPLASAPEMIAGRQGPPPGGGRTLGSWWVFGALAVLLAAMARGLVRAEPGTDRQVRALGRWVLAWAVICGLLSIVVGVVMSITPVPHFVQNELILTFVPLDLWLLWPAIGLVRGREHLLGAVRGYAKARLVLAVVVLAARIPGWLYQEPLAPPLFVLGGYAALVYLMSRVKAPAQGAASDVKV